jgi:threonyl-tRNA synthetase
MDLKTNQELGKELDLYIVSDLVGSGLPLLTPKGATIKREIERYVIDNELKRGYLHTSTPEMSKKELFEVSGHWKHYKENMFSCEIGGEIFALRPMTCPFHFLLYESKQRSYKDLPIRYAEMATLFRNEATGTLGGLTRLRQFTLSDSHILTRPDQLEEEFYGVIDLIKDTTQTLGIDDTWCRFSLWDPKNNKGKYVDNPEAWEKTQATMKKMLDKFNLEYITETGEAAFYGPKLDLQYKNIHGKEDTLITVQMDFALPERFNLTYVDENGEKQRPMVIHRSSSGCTERTMAYILEKTQGKLPLWLSPVQAKVLPITDDVNNYANQINQKIIQAGVRSEIDFRNERLGYKIREANSEKVPYLLIIGRKEQKDNQISVRKRGDEKNTSMSLDGVLKKLTNEIASKSK